MEQLLPWVWCGPRCAKQLCMQTPFALNRTTEVSERKETLRLRLPGVCRIVLKIPPKADAEMNVKATAHSAHTQTSTLH